MTSCDNEAVAIVFSDNGRLPMANAEIESYAARLFSKTERDKFYSLFRVGRVHLTPSHQSTKFREIEKFIIKYRHLPVPASHVPANKLAYWLFFVIPSCVYPKRLEGGGPFAYQYQCSICSEVCRQQTSLIRHYREQHNSVLPADIFGLLEEFKCAPCGQVYKRREHLEAHEASMQHLQVAARNGDSLSIAAIEAIEQSKEMSAFSKTLKLSHARQVEYNEWSRRSHDVTIELLLVEMVNTTVHSFQDQLPNIVENQSVEEVDHLSQTLKRSCSFLDDVPISSSTPNRSEDEDANLYFNSKYCRLY